jgi:hypothetical protein
MAAIVVQGTAIAARFFFRDRLFEKAIAVLVKRDLIRAFGKQRNYRDLQS